MENLSDPWPKLDLLEKLLWYMFSSLFEVTELISGINFAFGMCFDHENNT